MQIDDLVTRYPARARGPRIAPPASAPDPSPALRQKRARRASCLIVPEPQDNRPTPERLLKMPGRMRDGRPLLIGLIEMMWRRQDIGDEEVAAANRWHRDYVMGMLGGQDPEERRASGRADAHDAQLARIAAVSRCRAVRAALGLCAEVRLAMLLIEGLGYAAMAQRLFPARSDGERRIKAELTFLLGQLAEHYREVERLDRATRPGRG